MNGIPPVRVECYSFPKESFAKGVFLDSEKKFVRLHKVCCRSLEIFYKSSQQALNALVLAELFPNDVGKQIALDFHLKAEMKAKQTYEHQRRDLSDFIKAKVKTVAAKKTSRKRHREGTD